VALSPCRECGKSVSTDARRCPECGALDPTSEFTRTRTNQRLGCVVLVVLVFIIGYCEERAHPGGSPATVAGPAAGAPNLISYAVTRSWQIGPEGYGAELLIDPTRNGEADLRALATELHDEHRGNAVVFISVFDDAGAAAMAGTGKLLDTPVFTRRELVRYDQHFLMTYSKNPGSRLDEADLAPRGINGEHIKVRF
jgi:hypothetical protein